MSWNWKRVMSLAIVAACSLALVADVDAGHRRRRGGGSCGSYGGGYGGGYGNQNFGVGGMGQGYSGYGYGEGMNRGYSQGSQGWGRSQSLSGRGPHVGKGPKGFQRSPESLKERVCERLESDGALDASEIEVEVKNCEVTLTGKVCSREDKREAEQCAESVNGVKDVHNRLTVDPSIGASEHQQQHQKEDRTTQSRASKS